MSNFEMAQEAYEKRGMATYVCRAESKYNNVGADLWLEVPNESVQTTKDCGEGKRFSWMKSVCKRWITDSEGRRFQFFHGKGVYL